jgi:minor extracellular serine protease Vpr
MKRFAQALLAIFLLAPLGVAQVVPGRYVVELSGEPLGAAVKAQGKAALGTRHAQILSEQARTRTLIEGQVGKVLSSVDSVMNALLVNIPDEEAAALASLPGVKQVYPVHEYHLDLDHALPIHMVPAAWARIGGKDKAGAGIKIGIIDTGVSPDHPGFQDPSLKTPAGYPLASKPENLALTTNKIIVARSYEDIYQLKEVDDARDRFGHGTAVAMCAAGVTNKGPYGTITGVAPKAWIGGYKVFPTNSNNASSDVILKAMDDALADGMDVINLSLGSPFQFSPYDVEAVAVDRLTRFGVVVVAAAGNDGGSGLNTMSDFASLPSVIAAGAEENDRILSGSVAVAGDKAYIANPGNGPNSSSPISATVLDVASVDKSGLACSPLPAGSATGQIALILRGTCTFEQKLNDVQAGGAIAAIVYAAPANPAIFNMAVGAAELPAVSISNADGGAIRTKVTSDPSLTATITFAGVLFPADSHVVSSFSSKGPNWDYSIKPDLIAVGNYVYTAGQSVDPTGGLYSKDGYVVTSGTSFASPLTAGAAAVLRAARPGLTVDQYRSLLINGASALTRADGQVERVQRTGTGILNLDAALQNTITAFPTSLTFFIGNGTLGGAATGDFDQLTLTNIGKTTQTFLLFAIPYDTAPALQFSAIPSDDSPRDTLSVPIAPGQSKTVYVYWTADNLPIGEYQGQVSIQGTNTAILVPYWYGVPRGVPRSVFQLDPPPAQAKTSSTWHLFVRVTDDIGYAITDTPSLAFRGTANGGGTISLSPSIFFPNLRDIRLTLGRTPGDNTFQFSFGNLPPIAVTITGTSN